jgi:hypothetical protein
MRLREQAIDTMEAAQHVDPTPCGPLGVPVERCRILARRVTSPPCTNPDCEPVRSALP